MKPAYRKFLVIPGILIGAFGLALGLSQLKPEQEKRDDEKLDLLVEVLPLEVTSERFRISNELGRLVFRKRGRVRAASGTSQIGNLKIGSFQTLELMMDGREGGTIDASLLAVPFKASGGK